ncbi:hypothetical protein LMG27198_22350 [Methylocystis echinoides]|uniref:Uncharacterized protein n=2 Tax=Methylocystis echinoides TaxID=29468 RepID=A0A9W6GUM2_9HYPH|nr:hypothetical protein LMG27198_22350 [Methylocystis echinoides]
MGNALDNNNLNNDASSNTPQTNGGISLNDEQGAVTPSSPSPEPSQSSEPDNLSQFDDYGGLSVGAPSWLRADPGQKERRTDMKMKNLQSSPLHGPLYGGRTAEQINRDSKLKQLANHVMDAISKIEKNDGSNSFYPGEVNLAYSHYSQHHNDPFTLPELILNEEEEERVNWIIQDFIEDNPNISVTELKEKVFYTLKNAYQEAGRARVRERTRIAVLVRAEKYFGGIASNYHANICERVIKEISDQQKEFGKLNQPLMQGEFLHGEIDRLIARLLRQDERAATMESLKFWKK